MGKLAVKTGIWVLYEREYDTLSISAASKAARKKRLYPLSSMYVVEPSERQKSVGASQTRLRVARPKRD